MLDKETAFCGDGRRDLSQCVKGFQKKIGPVWPGTDCSDRVSLSFGKAPQVYGVKVSIKRTLATILGREENSIKLHLAIACG